MFFKSIFSGLVITLLLSKCTSAAPKAETPDLTSSFVSTSKVMAIPENTSVITLGLFLVSSLAVSRKSEG